VWTGWTNRQPIDLVIAGGESGDGARPMHPDWARKLRDQCAAAGVPFFFKQWGEWQPREWKHDGATHAVNRDHGRLHCLGHHPDSLERSEEAPSDWQGLIQVGKKKAGKVLDGREWNEMPVVMR
jgi:protein gp37